MENKLSEKTHSENRLSENTLSENTLSENTPEKSESVTDLVIPTYLPTYLITYLRTWEGARDTCVSKKLSTLSHQNYIFDNWIVGLLCH